VDSHIEDNYKQRSYVVDCYLPAPLLATMWVGTLGAASVEDSEDDDKRGSPKQFGWMAFWKTGKNILVHIIQ
jgi:hypothetical protein